jgi:hypothetical protein
VRKAKAERLKPCTRHQVSGILFKAAQSTYHTASGVHTHYLRATRKKQVYALGMGALDDGQKQHEGDVRPVSHHVRHLEQFCSGVKNSGVGQDVDL